MTYSREGKRAKSTLRLDPDDVGVVPKSEVISQRHLAQKAAEEEAATYTGWESRVLSKAGEIFAHRRMSWLDAADSHQDVRDIRRMLMDNLAGEFNDFAEDEVGKVPYSKNNCLIEAVYLLNGNVTPWLARTRSLKGDWAGVPVAVSDELLVSRDRSREGLSQRHKVAGQILKFALEYMTAQGYPVVKDYTDKYGKSHKQVVLPKP